MKPIQTLTVLGSTGSIGISTLDIVSRHPDRFRIFALSGHRQTAKLAEQCALHRPRYAVVADEQHARELNQLLQQQNIATEVLYGSQALCDIASAAEVDGVMAAIVGAAGLPPTLAAAAAGKTVYLANKETLVVSGSLFMDTARRAQAKVLPIDSEHNAIYQVLPPAFNGDLDARGISSIILTASGGPFLDTPLAQLADITPAQAVKHPNWSMGQKISVDSATMMNKGLELIEAHWLFNCPPERLETVVHPQSIIHSMVRYNDGSVLAQMGNPDMRTPIAYCLGLPERIESGVAPLDFYRLSELSFRQADTARFPCLQLAYDVMRQGGSAPCILNAANEIAVAAFLQQQIRFTDIPRLISRCLEHDLPHTFTGLDELLDIDRRVRHTALQYVNRL